MTCRAACSADLVANFKFHCGISDGINYFNTSLANFECKNSSAFSASSSARAVLGASLAVGVALIIFVAVVILFWRRRRMQSSSLIQRQLNAFSMDSARSKFFKEYGASLKEKDLFDASFAKLQLLRSKLHLGRELGRNRNSWVRQAFRLTDQHAVAVIANIDSDMQSQADLLCEALILHRFRHENVLSLVHVCRYFSSFVLIL